MEQIRCYLSLRELQRELLNLLLAFDSFCKREGLRYSLDSGTLLGAIRHKGFIPWDDDVDLAMPRPDYERLLSYSDKLPEGYFVVDPERDGMSVPFAKFCSKRVRAQEDARNEDVEAYLWIDLFPMDGAPVDFGELKKQKRIMYRSIRNNNLVQMNHDSETGIKGIGKKIAGRLYGFGDTQDKMLCLAREFARRFRYDDSDFVTCLVGVDKDAWSLKKSEFETTVEHEFAGHLFCAMSCWDDYLAMLYGDYMEIPPVESRTTHCLKAWYA